MSFRSVSHDDLDVHPTSDIEVDLADMSPDFLDSKHIQSFEHDFGDEDEQTVDHLVDPFMDDHYSTRSPHSDQQDELHSPIDRTNIAYAHKQQQQQQQYQQQQRMEQQQHQQEDVEATHRTVDSFQGSYAIRIDDSAPSNSSSILSTSPSTLPSTLPSILPATPTPTSVSTVPLPSTLPSTSTHGQPHRFEDIFDLDSDFYDLKANNGNVTQPQQETQQQQTQSPQQEQEQRQRKIPNPLEVLPSARLGATPAMLPSPLPHSPQSLAAPRRLSSTSSMGAVVSPSSSPSPSQSMIPILRTNGLSPVSSSLPPSPHPVRSYSRSKSQSTSYSNLLQPPSPQPVVAPTAPVSAPTPPQARNTSTPSLGGSPAAQHRWWQPTHSSIEANVPKLRDSQALKQLRAQREAWQQKIGADASDGDSEDETEQSTTVPLSTPQDPASHWKQQYFSKQREVEELQAIQVQNTAAREVLETQLIESASKLRRLQKRDSEKSPGELARKVVSLQETATLQNELIESLEQRNRAQKGHIEDLEKAKLEADLQHQVIVRTLEYKLEAIDESLRKGASAAIQTELDSYKEQARKDHEEQQRLQQALTAATEDANRLREQLASEKSRLEKLDKELTTLRSPTSPSSASLSSNPQARSNSLSRINLRSQDDPAPSLNDHTGSPSVRISPASSIRLDPKADKAERARIAAGSSSASSSTSSRRSGQMSSLYAPTAASVARQKAAQAQKEAKVARDKELAKEREEAGPGHRRAPLHGMQSMQSIGELLPSTISSLPIRSHTSPHEHNRAAAAAVRRARQGELEMKLLALDIEHKQSSVPSDLPLSRPPSQQQEQQDFLPDASSVCDDEKSGAPGDLDEMSTLRAKLQRRSSQLLNLRKQLLETQQILKLVSDAQGNLLVSPTNRTKPVLVGEADADSADARAIAPASRHNDTDTPINISHLLSDVNGLFGATTADPDAILVDTFDDAEFEAHLSTLDVSSSAAGSVAGAAARARGEIDQVEGPQPLSTQQLQETVLKLTEQLKQLEKQDVALNELLTEARSQRDQLSATAEQRTLEFETKLKQMQDAINQLSTSNSDLKSQLADANEQMLHMHHDTTLKAPPPLPDPDVEDLLDTIAQLRRQVATLESQIQQQQVLPPPPPIPPPLPPLPYNPRLGDLETPPPPPLPLSPLSPSQVLLKASSMASVALMAQQNRELMQSQSSPDITTASNSLRISTRHSAEDAKSSHSDNNHKSPVPPGIVQTLVGSAFGPPSPNSAAEVTKMRAIVSRLYERSQSGDFMAAETLNNEEPPPPPSQPSSARSAHGGPEVMMLTLRSVADSKSRPALPADSSSGSDCDQRLQINVSPAGPAASRPLSPTSSTQEGTLSSSGSPAVSPPISPQSPDMRAPVVLKTKRSDSHPIEVSDSPAVASSGAGEEKLKALSSGPKSPTHSPAASSSVAVTVAVTPVRSRSMSEFSDTSRRSSLHQSLLAVIAGTAPPFALPEDEVVPLASGMSPNSPHPAAAVARVPTPTAKKNQPCCSVM